MKGLWTLEEVNKIAKQKFNGIYTIEESIMRPGYYIVLFLLGTQAFIDSQTYFELLA